MDYMKIESAELTKFISRIAEKFVKKQFPGAEVELHKISASQSNGKINIDLSLNFSIKLDSLAKLIFRS